MRDLIIGIEFNNSREGKYKLMQRCFQSKRSTGKLSKKERREQTEKALKRSAERIGFALTDDGLWAVEHRQINSLAESAEQLKESKFRRQHAALNVVPKKTDSSFDLKSFLESVKAAIANRQEVAG